MIYTMTRKRGEEVVQQESTQVQRSVKKKGNQAAAKIERFAHTRAK